MNYQIIKPAQRHISNWAGGKTEELFIHPAGAQYSARDFDFRVSTAVVELGQSDFTPLPSYTRWIATLEGHICLTHKEHGQQINLEPMQPHCFEGGWSTRCTGTCTDFNLMLGCGWNGYISPTPQQFLCAAREIIGVFAFGAPVALILLPGSGQMCVGMDDPNVTPMTIPAERILLAHRDMFIINTPCAITVEDHHAAQSILFKAWAD